MSPTKHIEHLKIALQDILLSADYFAEEKLIAKGGFGTVYIGQSEQHGTIAVKRLNTKRGQGYKEFMNEVMLLSYYKHENIVSLVGFCDEKGMNILVYKYESKGSLDKHINSKDLTWIQRLRICIDAASGLKYLHEDVGPQHRIIHRDVKSANILLDENWKAKISDFGFAKQTPANVELSMVISHPCGTMGYVAPEYENDKILTKESDVFSFGVVLLEVLCGRPACVSKPGGKYQLLYELARKHYKEGTLLEIVDSTVQNEMFPASFNMFSLIAFRCLSEEKERRPLMSEVVKELNKALDDQTNMRLIPKISSMPSTSEGTLDDADTQDIFMSRQFIYKAALESLNPKNKTQKLALCGMGGVGKTTMMEKLEEAVKKTKMFHTVIMVVIGKNPDPIALQQGIADYMPESLTETRREARSRRLKEMFLEMSQNGTKNILIILDDVWEPVDLKDIGLAPLLPKGFKLFLTSRYETTYFDMDPWLDGGERERIVTSGLESICAERYKNAKYDFKKKQFVDRGGYEAPDHLRNDPPDGVPLGNWQSFVDFVTKPTNVARAETNSINRSKLPFPSQHGSQSYVSRRARRRAESPTHPPSHIDNWRAMHSDINTGVWNSPEAQNLYEQMVALRTQSPDLTEEEILETVLGTRRGHNRGRGKRLPIASTSSMQSSSSSRGATSRAPKGSSSQQIQENIQQQVNEQMMMWFQSLQAVNPGLVIPQFPNPYPNDNEDDDNNDTDNNNNNSNED